MATCLSAHFAPQSPCNPSWTLPSMYFKNKSIIHPHYRYKSPPLSLLACKLMLRFTLRIELFVDRISSTIHHISKSSHFREGASALAREMIDDTRDSGPPDSLGMQEMSKGVCCAGNIKCEKIFRICEEVCGKCQKVYRKCKKFCGKCKKVRRNWRKKRCPGNVKRFI